MADRVYNTRAWREVRKYVLQRDGYKCGADPMCQSRATAVDHIIPWRDGGDWYDPANLRAICMFHNSSRVRRSRVGKAKPNPSRNWLT